MWQERQAVPSQPLCLGRSREEGVNSSGKHDIARHKGRGGPRRVRSRASLRQLARAEVDTDTRFLSVQIGHVV